MATDPETRKAIAQRAIDRAAAHGAPIDQDPAFVALLDEWVQGEIEFKEMRERYLGLWRSRPPSDADAGRAGWAKSGRPHRMSQRKNKKNGPADTAAHEAWRS